MKTVTILGATGSVGTSTLDLVEREPDRFRVRALTANCDVRRLAEAAIRTNADLAVVADETCLPALREALSGTKTDCAGGAQAVCDAATGGGLDNGGHRRLRRAWCRHGGGEGPGASSSLPTRNRWCPPAIWSLPRPRTAVRRCCRRTANTMRYISVSTLRAPTASGASSSRRAAARSATGRWNRCATPPPNRRSRIPIGRWARRSVSIRRR